MAADGAIPELTIDPFSREFLSDPYPRHDEMREAGAVVRLTAYGVYAMARHDEVQTALRDWRTYCSSAGVGLSDFRKEKPWRPPSLVLEADPPLHTRTRAVLSRVLSPGVLNDLRPLWQERAENLVEDLVARRDFDAVSDVGEVYPLQVFPDALGLRETGRENLLPYGSMVFDAFGPRNWLFEQAMANAAPVIDWILSSCKREALSREGLGAAIYAAADSGDLSEHECWMLMRSFLSAGVDTTVNGLSNAIFCLAENPDQWALLRNDPSLARRAFEEALRFESTVQTFFRTTTRDVEVAGTTIPSGQKVLLFLGAANRDPRRWENPDAFEVTRATVGHVGFGLGIHGCVGQMVARLEGELVLTALAKRVQEIALTSEPQRRLNNTLRAFSSVPVRVTRR